jgi:hypothetical protein
MLVFVFQPIKEVMIVVKRAVSECSSPKLIGCDQSMNYSHSLEHELST